MKRNIIKLSQLESFLMKAADILRGKMDASDIKGLIPPLLRSYFTAGAKVYGEPALDLDFKCIDFLTILDVNNLTSGYKRRYFKGL